MDSTCDFIPRTVVWGPVFFFAVYSVNWGSPNGHFEKTRKFSTFKCFYLRSESVSEEKSQGKNENFGALRAATRTGGEKKQEEKFFDFRIVGPKAT